MFFGSGLIIGGASYSLCFQRLPHSFSFRANAAICNPLAFKGLRVLRAIPKFRNCRNLSPFCSFRTLRKKQGVGGTRSFPPGTKISTRTSRKARQRQVRHAHAGSRRFVCPHRGSGRRGLSRGRRARSRSAANHGRFAIYPSFCWQPKGRLQAARAPAQLPA